MIRFQALAVDYDRTLSSHDRLADAMVAALERARQAGLQLVLVTGRTFFELTRVCDRLDLFDVVVAENGAVLHDPADGAIRDEGPEPPPRLIAALARAGIPCQVGRVAFAFRRSDGCAVATADTLRSLLTCLKEVDDDVLAHHAPRGDLSRWIADVFLDRRLASQVRKAERRVDTEGASRLRAALIGLLARLIAS